MTRAPALILLVGLLFLGLTPVIGQDAGQGLIVEGNPVGEAALGALNPLLCSDAGCRRLTKLMFPSLLRIDPQTRTFAPATATEGLADSWALDGNTVTFHLRTDRVWSDGTPITAYDVYFSALATMSDQVNSPYKTALRSLIRAAVPLDAGTFAIALKTPNCDTLDQLNFPIIPAHVFDTGFADSVQFPGGDVTAWYDAQPTYDFSGMLASTFNRAPTVTGGPFRFDSRAYDQNVRLISADGLRAFDYVDSTDANETVNRFLRGEINLLIDPPYERRQDIRATNGVSVIEQPGNVLYSLRLNQADPNHPASDRDEDGRLLDQGKHPIFSDPAVVSAMQMAINPQALIDATVEGDGVAVAGTLPPSSWAFDGVLPIAFDPMAAARLLEAAGWKDTNGDGVRECITCATAEHNAPLSFTLIYKNADLDGIVASLIRQQLGAVGIQVDTAPFDNFDQIIAQQSFDAALVSDRHPFPDAPDQSATFTAAGDVLDSGLNATSYRNDSLTALFDQALRVPSCDVKTRADLYAQAQQVMHADRPAIGLFAPNRMIAVRGDARTLQPLVEEMTP